MKHLLQSTDFKLTIFPPSHTGRGGLSMPSPLCEQPAEGQPGGRGTNGAGKPAGSAGGHLGLAQSQLAVAVLDLRKRGMTVTVEAHVGVEQFTECTRHFQRGNESLIIPPDWPIII